MSLYCDSSVLVKLYVREESSDAVARFLAARGEAVIVNDPHELKIRNALRLKRFRDEIDDGRRPRRWPCLQAIWLSVG